MTMEISEDLRHQDKGAGHPLRRQRIWMSVWSKVISIACMHSIILSEHSTSLTKLPSLFFQLTGFFCWALYVMNKEVLLIFLWRLPLCVGQQRSQQHWNSPHSCTLIKARYILWLRDTLRHTLNKRHSIIWRFHRYRCTHTNFCFNCTRCPQFRDLTWSLTALVRVSLSISSNYTTPIQTPSKWWSFTYQEWVTGTDTNQP